MSAPDHKPAVSPDVDESLAGKTARMMEDPFGSVWLGLVAPAAAVGFVVSGILGIGIVA